MAWLFLLNSIGRLELQMKALTGKHRRVSLLLYLSGKVAIRLGKLLWTVVPSFFAFPGALKSLAVTGNRNAQTVLVYAESKTKIA